MAGTTLQDVIVPELFTPYVVSKTMEKSALVQCGIISRNPDFDRLASQASPLVTMPFFEDLTGESEAVVESQDLTLSEERRCGARLICPQHWQEKILWRPLDLL